MIDFGLDRSEFRSIYFEKSPFLRRACFDHSPFSWGTIDRALDLQDPTRELLKVLHNGRVDPSHYVEEYVDIGLRRRRVLKDRLYERLAAGATIVLNRIELVSPEVRDVCLEIGRLIGAQTTSNAYACLGGDPATNIHWDTHDVFVVQIGGRKHWRLYEPTHPLPISSQISNDRKDEVIGDPAVDVILEAGDILYVPRGWWHQVVPVPGSDTLHLTVAIHTPLILDFLIWACGSILPELVDVRHSLLGEAHDEARLAQAVASVSAALRHPATLQAFYARSRERERVVSPFNIAALVEQRDNPLPMDTSLMLGARHPDGNAGPFLLNGRSVVLAGEHEQVARALSCATCLTLEELHRAVPAIAPEALQTIVKDLARADIVHIAALNGGAAPALVD